MDNGTDGAQKGRRQAGPSVVLLSQHQRLVDDSAVAPEVARVREYRSVRTKAELKEFGFTDRQRRVPALLIPQVDSPSTQNRHHKVIRAELAPEEVG